MAATKVTSSEIEQPAWITPTFQNGWTQYALGYDTVAYRKDSNNMVHLKGLTKSGSVNSTIFTLPAGYRPAGTLIFTVNSGDGTSRVDVGGGGTVNLSGGAAGAQNYLSLSGISFRAEQ